MGNKLTICVQCETRPVRHEDTTICDTCYNRTLMRETFRDLVEQIENCLEKSHRMVKAWWKR